ncbi:MAG: hypothetical protein N2117_07095 [Anaerolineales bacterium]|nr:hypothetical protein [Anaerolineales bacterium]MCX7754997.1 hypothetical protein [Anaerolineales bacterium]MDW8277375.1 hypothetical protein [Anaerolineales bacterium]
MRFFDGFHAGFMFFQALNCLVLLTWLGLSIAALLGLRKKHIGETARVLWTLVILIVPIMGAVSFWIVNPKDESTQDQSVG